MNIFRILLVATVAMFVNVSNAGAQAAEIDKLIVGLTVISNPDIESFNSSDGASFIADTTEFNVKFNLMLNSTDSIQTVHLKLGSTDGGTEKEDLVINFDGSNLPSGVTHSLVGNMLIIGVGVHSNMLTYYAEASLVRTDSSESTVKKFSIVQ